ncbi:hypothetical protein IV203_011432 [Nitzschia inconspicua]|uniref:Uncharacterized protein n=1 Tax=Nitzschia inconspicua TaxID=303405 RepID=A0A9K3PIV4_9STRA|nr:hypothetical protein IV203_011432 [Nitzschia inconspicua]
MKTSILASFSAVFFLRNCAATTIRMEAPTLSPIVMLAGSPVLASTFPTDEPSFQVTASDSDSTVSQLRYGGTAAADGTMSVTRRML